MIRTLLESPLLSLVHQIGRDPQTGKATIVDDQQIICPFDMAGTYMSQVFPMHPSQPSPLIPSHHANLKIGTIKKKTLSTIWRYQILPHSVLKNVKMFQVQEKNIVSKEMIEDTRGCCVGA